MVPPERIAALPAQVRYDHFIKQAADSAQVWGLHMAGWALAAADDGSPVFPVWPSAEFAQLLACDDWAGYVPTSIPLWDFLREVLPALQTDGIAIGVCYLLGNRAPLRTSEQLANDLMVELQKYE